EHEVELGELSKIKVDGVGLYRTEHLYFNRAGLPSEEEQFNHYRLVAESARPGVAVIRTLDPGGDQPPPAIADFLPEETNPALGMRGIRLALRHQEILQTQLQAILRAAAHGDVWIMFPMVSNLDEVKAAREVLDRARTELRKKGHAFGGVKEGVLVETPAAALSADLLARELDFLSIGTNDLTQFTLAVDRTNKDLAGLFDPFHPAMIRMFMELVRAAQSAGVPISVCGELAGDPDAALAFIGMGYRSFSMTISKMPMLEQAVREITIEESEAFAAKLLKCETGGEIRSLFNETPLRPSRTPFGFAV
ncbi:putative PEP-binding protein, partial [Nitrospinota bacterium]